MSVVCQQFALNNIKSTRWIVTKIDRYKWWQPKGNTKKNLSDFKIIWYKWSFDDYQSCSNYFDWLKNMAARGCDQFFLCKYMGNFKNLVWNGKVYNLDIWCGPLPSLFKLWPCAQIWPHPGDHMFIEGENGNVVRDTTLTVDQLLFFLISGKCK